jgi:oligopeptide/dipeptide ABC transporter ATP-binding protein
MGIVGESGSGKSVTAMSILRLIPSPPGKIVDGKIIFDGQDLLKLSEKEIRKIRGNKIAMIFQEPMTSLNPVFTIGSQIMEAILLHQDVTKEEAREKAIEMLRLVGIPAPEKRVDDYPHQFSGGMRQRAMIAMALSCNPSLLIADEPTTALDVTIQAQILDLMLDIKEKVGDASIILITHDLAVVAEVCDKVTVMYCGKVMEQTDVYTLFKNPKHPYTIGLLNSIPGIKIKTKDQKLYTIPGIVPSIFDLPKGCKFCTRCERADEKCKLEEPELKEIEPGHFVRCHYVD